AGWLRKIRPWCGHDYHFHVRIRCPSSGSPECTESAEIPASTTESGCDETLAWWFSEEARDQAWMTGQAGKDLEDSLGPRHWPILPDACDGLMSPENPKPPAG
ncbi:MAG: penicillin-insensitive murein endopeptidase, partial [Bdellovibrionota bacterium]